MAIKSQPIEINEFIARSYEQSRLLELVDSPKAEIIIVHGRRRVGKTTLIEHTYSNQRLLKFEGLQQQSEGEQQRLTLAKLAQYVDTPLITNLKHESWVEIFEAMAQYVAEGKWVLYFEEVQWLADYKPSFISALKYVWDNHFRHNPKLKIILCGSSPSFMIKEVLQSSALYNRSTNELPLKPFTIKDTQLFFKKRSHKELMDMYLTIGGIPEYFNQIINESSFFVGICKHSFTQGGYFAGEYERIFVSSLSENKNYKKIIAYLSKRKFATRAEIMKHLKTTSGGHVSLLLKDLELSSFVESYVPYTQTENSLLKRYCIRDNYLNFYYKFIAPVKKQVDEGDFQESPIKALDAASYQVWLGFAFERFCRQNHRLIAKILGFEDVKYRHGTFYNRNTNKIAPGYQIDLLFERADHVLTICEIRYRQNKIGVNIIQEVENKIELLDPPKKYSIQRVLISQEGPQDTLVGRAYFNRFILLEDFFK